MASILFVFGYSPRGQGAARACQTGTGAGIGRTIASNSRFIRDEIRLDEADLQTRLAHEATEYAREHGKGNQFHKTVFHKVYAEGEDPSQWDMLRSAAEEVGLDADEMQREVEAEKYRANVEDQVRWAYQIGVSGVPTYVIDDRYAIVGAQPYEVFKSALAQIKEKESST